MLLRKLSESPAGCMEILTLWLRSQGATRRKTDFSGHPVFPARQLDLETSLAQARSCLRAWLPADIRLWSATGAPLVAMPGLDPASRTCSNGTYAILPTSPMRRPFRSCFRLLLLVRAACLISPTYPHGRFAATDAETLCCPARNHVPGATAPSLGLGTLENA